MLFWHCWSQEYLNKLQVNSKWKKSLQNLQIKTTCLVERKKNDKFTDLKLTRIKKTYKGEDGQVCAIDLKTSTGMLCICRSITRVVHLPFYDEFGQPSITGQDVQANSENS